MSRPAAALVLVILASLVVVIPTARAEEDMVAKHKSAGVAYFKAGAFDKAIEEFEAAYALSPEPNLLFNLGRASEEQGRKAEAVSYYEQFLTTPESEERADEARARATSLKRAIAAEQADADAEARKVAKGKEQNMMAAALEKRAADLNRKAEAEAVLGRYEQAIAIWQQARAVADLPVYLFRIAKAQKEEGDLTAAVGTLEAYLAKEPTGSKSNEARGVLAEVRQELALRVARAAGDGSPAWLDGRSRWGLSLRTGLVVLNTLSASCYAEDDNNDFTEMGQGAELLNPGYSTEASLSLAIVRWVAVEVGVSWGQVRMANPCDNLDVSAHFNMPDVSARLKATLLPATTQRVLNLYAGMQTAIGFSPTVAFEGGMQTEETEYTNFTDQAVNIPIAGVEGGIRYAAGELLLDLRFQLETPPVGASFSVPEEVGVTYGDTHSLKLLVAYAYRGG